LAAARAKKEKEEMEKLLAKPQKPILFSHPQYELDDGNKLKRKADAGEQTIDEMESLLDAMTTFVQVSVMKLLHYKNGDRSSDDNSGNSFGSITTAQEHNITTSSQHHNITTAQLQNTTHTLTHSTTHSNSMLTRACGSSLYIHIFSGHDENSNPLPRALDPQ